MGDHLYLFTFTKVALYTKNAIYVIQLKFGKESVNLHDKAV